MAKYVHLPDPIAKGRGRNREWWIPPCPPHFSEPLGPYDSEEYAIDDQLGLEGTINTPTWRSVIMDMHGEPG